MKEREIIRQVNNVLELFLDFEFIVKKHGIERGYAIHYNNKQGVIIEDTITSEYNFYNWDQYNALWELAIGISEFRKNIANIENRYTRTLCTYYCMSVVDIADRMLSDQLLFPLLAHLLGETSNKNRYVIKIDYTL